MICHGGHLKKCVDVWHPSFKQLQYVFAWIESHMSLTNNSICSDFFQGRNS